MKTNIALALVAGMLATKLLPAPALAFHDDGVAHCNGCHTIHNSEDGTFVDPDSPSGNGYLLRDASATDVCLGCHATRLGAVWGDDPLAPPPELGGGNFTFLLEDNINDGHAGAQNPILGYEAGHSVIAPSKGAGPDGKLSVAPGGTFPASLLSCTSCHDPHGNDAFRLLYGIGPVQDGVATFTAPGPIGEDIGLSGAEANDNHSAYRSGMSAWCGNCHGNFHDEAGGRLIHPSGSAIGGGIATAYNLYNGTDDITGGIAATAYLAAVPFEDPAATMSSTAGPSATGQIMCLTCHRAHATSAPDAGRWDFNVTFLHEDGVESGSYQIPDPYSSLNQRSLCNKCHAKDAGDSGFGVLDPDPPTGPGTPVARKEKRKDVIGS
jgi:hypothetical protein